MWRTASRAAHAQYRVLRVRRHSLPRLHRHIQGVRVLNVTMCMLLKPEEVVTGGADETSTVGHSSESFKFLSNIVIYREGVGRGVYVSVARSLLSGTAITHQSGAGQQVAHTTQRRSHPPTRYTRVFGCCTAIGASHRHILRLSETFKYFTYTHARD